MRRNLLKFFLLLLLTGCVAKTNPIAVRHLPILVAPLPVMSERSTRTVARVAVIELPPRPVLLMWDYPGPTIGGLPLEQVTFTIVGFTNFPGTWYFVTNVIGTNFVSIPKTKRNEFFTISRVYETSNTNNYIKRVGF